MAGLGLGGGLLWEGPVGSCSVTKLVLSAQATFKAGLRLFFILTNPFSWWGNWGAERLHGSPKACGCKWTSSQDSWAGVFAQIQAPDTEEYIIVPFQDKKGKYGIQALERRRSSLPSAHKGARSRLCRGGVGVKATAPCTAAGFWNWPSAFRGSLKGSVLLWNWSKLLPQWLWVESSPRKWNAGPDSTWATYMVQKPQVEK